MKKGIGPNNLGSPAKMGHGMKSMAKMYNSPAKKMTDPPIMPKDAKTVSDSVGVELDYIAKKHPMAYQTIYHKANKSVERNPYYSPSDKQRRRDLLDNTRSIASRFGIDTKKAYKE
jgi:hypothetical protein